MFYSRRQRLVGVKYFESEGKIEKRFDEDVKKGVSLEHARSARKSASEKAYGVFRSDMRRAEAKDRVDARTKKGRRGNGKP